LTVSPNRSHELLVSLWRHRRLAWTLAKRDIQDEHVGQSFGLGWTILQPLLVMGTYLFVFTFVFFTRLEDAPRSDYDFTVFLFSGLTPWLTLTLVLGKAPMAVVQNAAIVKQVALPLEIIARASTARRSFSWWRSASCWRTRSARAGAPSRRPTP